MMEFAKEVDARGLNCPLPILRCKKGLSEIEATGVKSDGDGQGRGQRLQCVLSANRPRAFAPRHGGWRVYLLHKKTQ